MKPSECLMILRARNEADFMLQRFLDHNSPLFDCFVAIADRCDDDTFKILRQHTKCAMVVDKVKGKGADHPGDYALMAQMADLYDYDWMWQLDADELVSHTVLDEMPHFPEDHAVVFHHISLFPDEQHFISGNHAYDWLVARAKLYPRGSVGFPRLWTSNPMVTHRYSFSQSFIYHYHMITEERRLLRYNINIKEDPDRIGPPRPIEKRKSKFRHIVKTDGAHCLPISQTDIGNAEQLIQHLTDLPDIYDGQKLDVDRLLRILNRSIKNYQSSINES